MKLSTKLLTSVALGALTAMPVITPVFGAVGEIIVTTRKRAESLQDAPVSVTAFTAETIARQGIANIRELANQVPHPESVPINMLVRVAGTPLAEAAPLDPIEFVRTIAVARVLMPHSHVRLSAGREQMSDELQALCFLAGDNSVFYGEKLLTTPNPDTARDQALFARLGLHAG